MVTSLHLNKAGRVLVLGAVGLVLVWANRDGLNQASAQSAAVSVPGTGAPEPLVWLEAAKTNSPKAGDVTANVTFDVTNVSDGPVVILSATASCGCTVPNLPANPWVVAPHASGQLPVVMNLAGKMGSFTKTVLIVRSNLAPQELTLTINMLDTPETSRLRNRMTAMTDRQAVFKGDCAKCHFEPAKGKMAAELYTAACAICHDSEHRATMVPNLRALNHASDYAFWKQQTAVGRPGTLMPAFSEKQGGPLTDEQIESLAQMMAREFPAVAAVAPTAPTNALQSVTPNRPKFIQSGGRQP